LIKWVVVRVGDRIVATPRSTAYGMLSAWMLTRFRRGPSRGARHAAVPVRGESVEVTGQDAALAWLTAELRPGDVLVKRSRYRTWQVDDALRPVG
jgi:hypothetical protein